MPNASRPEIPTAEAGSFVETPDIPDTVQQAQTTQQPMTVAAIVGGLLPILWSDGAGADVMKRIAAPMVGGMLSSTVLTLAVIPAIYTLVKQWRLSRGLEQ